MAIENKRDGVGDYVRHVHESTQEYTRAVLADHEKLVVLVAALNAEKLRLEESLAAAEERVKRQDAVQSSLLAQNAELEATRQSFTARYVEVEQLNANLANLYVASYRIHGSLDREEVLSTLHEILINMIGTEEFAVFEREPGQPTLRVASSFGVDAGRIDARCLAEGELGEAIAHGRPYVSAGDAGTSGAPGEITACVPLHVGERAIGAIVIYRLLAHKASLEALDIELFNLLATHGATALYCSELHARRGELRA